MNPKLITILTHDHQRLGLELVELDDHSLVLQHLTQLKGDNNFLVEDIAFFSSSATVDQIRYEADIWLQENKRGWSVNL